MASQPIRRARLKLLDEMGEEEIARLYLEECGTVRKLMARLFEPLGGGQPGATDFYRWLRLEPGREEWWRTVKETRGHMVADEAVDIAMDSDETNVRSSRLKVDTLKWHASKLNPKELGDRLELGGGGDTAKAWLGAMIAAEELVSAMKPERQLLEAEVIDAEELEEPAEGSGDASR